jgi:hypothetical protein
MNKTFKKSDITDYLKRKKNNTNTKEGVIKEFINPNGSMISMDNNYKTSTNLIRSKKTTDDRVRNSTQGPEAYFIYGGPYYGVNYSYIVNEEEDILDLDSEDDVYDELNVVPSKYSRDSGDRMIRQAKDMADKDIRSHFNKPADPVYDHLPVDKWRGHSLDYDTEFDIDLYSESEDRIKDIVDEIMLKKKTINNSDLTKRTNEEEILGGESVIPDISELKDVHEKPIIIRKINSLMDLIHKEDLNGIELSILLNHIINNIDINSIDEKHREILGDKIKYGEQEGK